MTLSGPPPFPPPPPFPSGAGVFPGGLGSESGGMRIWVRVAVNAPIAREPIATSSWRFSPRTMYPTMQVNEIRLRIVMSAIGGR